MRGSGEFPYPVKRCRALQNQHRATSQAPSQCCSCAAKSPRMLPSLSLPTSNLAPSLPKLTFSSLTKSSFHGIRIGFPGRAHVAGGQISRRVQAAPVVMMAKREEELKEIRAKTTEELNEEIVDLKGELFVLRLQKSARADFKNSEFSRMRKRIARMLTVKRERELEEGINKRLSRKLDRKWKKSIVFRPPPSLKKLQVEESAAKEAESSA